MDIKKGYIYIRDHQYYAKDNVIKLGITASILDRENTYITGEFDKGEYLLIVEIYFHEMKQLDKSLKFHLRKYHKFNNAGHEFYKKDIIEIIIPCLNKLTSYFKILTKEEINNLDRISKNDKDEIYKNFEVMPNEQQYNVLEQIENFYKSNDIGKIIWACGLGKALLSIMIAKLLDFKIILIGVPSKFLQKQMKKEVLKIFPNISLPVLLNGKTDKNMIKSHLNNELYDVKFIISTYHSCKFLVDDGIIFDFKIGDEAHHLVGDNKGFCDFHKINSYKTLFMTATELISKSTYSMDDELIFGKNIDTKTIYWAIKNKKITDHNILILKNTENEVNYIIKELGIDVQNKELFISCYICLKSFEKYEKLTHILLYTNSINDAELTKNYISKILDLEIINIDKKDIYNDAIHSKNDNENDIDLFKNKKYGIISCIYKFGEGFDLPKLNGVCVAENMQSEIRIIQYLLRPNRLDINNPDKIAYIIIPCVESSKNLESNSINRKQNVFSEKNNKSYEKIKNIILQMSIDENIKYKISLLTSKDNSYTFAYNHLGVYFDFEENVDELSKLKLQLIYHGVLNSGNTKEENEYNYIKSINICLNIQSKQEYYNSKLQHENFIENPEEYFKRNGLWKNWYNFIGYNTSKFIPTKDEWIKFCKEKNIKTLEEYNLNCELYNSLPKIPDEFYEDFTNFHNELNLYSNKRWII